jgi:hypothetical protein
MKGELGFKVETLFTSKFKINARDAPYRQSFNTCLLVADFGVVQMQEQNMRSRMGKCTRLALFILTRFAINRTRDDRGVPLIEQGMIEVVE